MHSEENLDLSAAMALPQSEEGRVQILNIDDLFDAFISVDRQERITGWNLQAEDIFGWPRREALGRPVSQLIIPPRNRHLFKQTVRQFVSSNENSAQRSRTRITALHPDGTEFEIEVIFFSLHSDNGIGMIARQLSERKFTEVETEKRHHAIMNQLGECYAETDLRGSFTFINKTYCETFGTSMEARQGGNYKTIFPSELAGLLRETYTKVYRTGETAKIDYSLTLQNGKQVFNEQSVSLKKDVQGNPVGFLVIVRDCYERKQSELELVRAKQAAETASKAKGEFLANMSHEIRTPLNGVIGMLELIGYTNPTPEQQELLKIAQSAADSLLAVINDILDFSKVEAGKLELDLVEFDVFEVVSQAVAIMSSTALKKGLKLSSELTPDVPQFVLGDPLRLKQVLLNLTGNAIKFTQHGQVKVLVQKEKANDGKVELRFSVIDSGIGIPVEKRTVIFEDFAQADASTTRKFGGTGLGLTISAHIVRLMQGNIWVESEVGKGSAFHFTAVLEIVDGAEAKSAQAAVVSLQMERNHELRVLLAEDNLVNQKLAVRLLEKLGHQVSVVRTGMEALAKLEEQRFDLVLMDVQMPEMDGFSATVAIRAREEKSKPRMPIVAMTAHAMKGDRERCVAAGMDDYISKPINLDTLKKIIASVTKS